MAAKRRPVDNHQKGASTKVELRQWVLNQLESSHVLDAFAGSGTMYRSVWREAQSYTGCDKRLFRDSRRAYVVDNVRLLRTLDLAAFTIFDLDAYGSPWQAVTILAARRSLAPGELVAIVTTDGAMMRAQLGKVERHAAGLSGMQGYGVHSQWDALTRRAMDEAARRMGGQVQEMRAAQRRTQFYAAAVIAGRA